ncbi:2-oxoglutarate dehydrogenase complex dihydrolipoyllysine-residue succinyltransferase [Algisphaera agarilytica]|uniref:Dihydrolipoyllysine-residue succinyltransferase component of 2-oxoglutarate dehydrogenase complex n=1 Tax=Algisphaera agarilytica TaxID=1385975 RepID=A0A7X0LJY7_9BACT|nr:2-oxoglutarate dehydrogenase complex dihydrolipoyllysine-residue succinyltransferase [Algisphaera agarilytica]MBB6429269.1 2-oxoglutarate dehydrogenase E2 component (dihydrolipoamide succinyltransferase) [Algisphaera agarilytica]
MPTELIVPEVGESITEVEIGQWLKAEGDAVSKDDPLVEIETDKVTLELPAPADGAIVKITHPQGTPANVGDVIGTFEEGAAGSAPAPAAPTETAPQMAEKLEAATPPAPAASNGTPGASVIMPAAQRLIDENKLDAAAIPATGPGGRLLKEDVQNFLKSPPKPAAAERSDKAPDTPTPATPQGDRSEEVVPMTSLRKRIAANLVDAQQTAALLTTFNEVDMTNVMALRSQYKDQFLKSHDVKLGFMSFFVRASIDALKQCPAINAEVRGTDIVYKNYYDIGIAIGGGKGLVVPILRNAERMSFAGIEKAIGDYAVKAKANKLAISDLTGGTFTITNGGIYGSLLSTPIVNPPQSGVLGMHGIVRRPIAVDPGTPKERVEVRPMMYIALTYDHRIVDGREAVTCLKRIKETIEDPARMLMEV